MSGPVLYHRGGFPPSALDWPRLVPLIGPANAAVARYAGLLQGIPNPNVLLSPLSVQEAVLSSRIEGTQATMGEVLEAAAGGARPNESTRKGADIFEVLNYRAALNEATRLLSTLPLSQRLIRATHGVLMQGVRGRNKDPGEYRRVPNWIGVDGCALDQARFVPCPVDHLAAAMAAWETYLHVQAPDLMVQLAIAHAEFEAIHPFLDGNGRLGRLIIPLFLYERRVLAQPTFYLSEYLEARRDEYYARLLAVSRDGDWTGWCVFFLTALIDQAQVNQNRVQAILDLYRVRKDWIIDATHSQHGVRALDWMFQQPIFNSRTFIADVEIPPPTARRILKVCVDQGLLKILHPARGSRSAVYCFPELLNIAEGRAAF